MYVKPDLLVLAFHCIDLVQIDVREQRGRNPALRHTPFALGAEHQFKEPQYLVVRNPSGHLREQDVMPDRIEKGLQVKIDNPCLVTDHRAGHTIDCLVGFLFRAVPVGAFLEIGFKDRFKQQFQRSFHHAVPDARDT